MLRKLKRIGLKQARNAARLLARKPVTLTPLVSMTLNDGDVSLARNLLNGRDEWFRSDATVKKYESDFAAWNGSRFSFAFMSGRVALSALIHGLALQRGDQIIVPGYTCVVVPNACRFAGIDVTYCDIELETYGLDAACFEKLITPRTAAVILHHLYGLVSRDLGTILEIARNHGIKVIEDCAQATGAEFAGQKVGTFGDAAFYSSERSKMQNTIMGGVAVTDSPAIAARVQEYYDAAAFPDPQWVDKLLHNVLLDYYRFAHPQRWILAEWAEYRYRDKLLISTTKQEQRGIRPANYGCRMPPPIAALALNQLSRANAYIERRRQQARQWDLWCESTSFRKPLEVERAKSVYLRYPVLVPPHRKKNTDWLTEELAIEPGTWFVSNLHPSNQVVKGCPNANLAVAQCINLPTLLS